VATILIRIPNRALGLVEEEIDESVSVLRVGDKERHPDGLVLIQHILHVIDSSSLTYSLSLDDEV
jgi:hypothetical protein